jgi:hypothetical protein
VLFNTIEYALFFSIVLLFCFLLPFRARTFGCSAPAAFIYFSSKVRLKPDTARVIQFQPRILSIGCSAIVLMLASIEGVV